MKIRKTAVHRTRKGKETSTESKYEISSWELAYLVVLVLALTGGDTAGFIDLIENLRQHLPR